VRGKLGSVIAGIGPPVARLSGDLRTSIASRRIERNLCLQAAILEKPGSLNCGQLWYSFNHENFDTY
jgi:hypothetical protein